MQEDIIKEFREKFAYNKDAFFYKSSPEDIEAFIFSAVSQAKEEGRKQGVEEYKKELKRKMGRIKLEVDTVICDCGEPYKDSDLAILINELKDLIN
jgi:hypothetical protein